MVFATAWSLLWAIHSHLRSKRVKVKYIRRKKISYTASWRVRLCKGGPSPSSTRKVSQKNESSASMASTSGMRKFRSKRVSSHRSYPIGSSRAATAKENRSVRSWVSRDHNQCLTANSSSSTGKTRSKCVTRHGIRPTARRFLRSLSSCAKDRTWIQLRGGCRRAPCLSRAISSDRHNHYIK